jgi:hypothetical protein
MDMRVTVLVWASEDSDKDFFRTAWALPCPNPMPGPSEIEIRPLCEVADPG